MEFSLAQSAVLSEKEQLLLHQKLWSLFEAAANEFTNRESSSVSEENALRLLSSVCFILQEYLEETGHTERDLALGNIDEAFKYVKAVLLKRVDEARELWNKAVLTIPKIQSRALTDTMQGIKYGLSHYSTDLFAAEVPGSIDYQLMLPVSEKALGIEYIILWLRELLLENYILSRFEAKAVRSVLLRVCPFYPELIINLCENPLQNAIGLILLQKDPFSLYITHSDRLALTETFASLSKQECEDLLCAAAQKICVRLLIPKESCKGVEAFAKSLAPRIMASIPSKLCGVFV